MKYIDIHGHLNFVAYDEDREEAIKRATDLEVAMITVGTEYGTSKSALELAKRYRSMYAVAGLHPVHTSRSHHDSQELGSKDAVFSEGEEVDMDKYLAMARDPKVVAIGESGLDYYHAEDGSEGKQVRVFEKMIDIANEVGKPLMLHIRNGSGKSAYRQAHDIISGRAKVKGNLHFFAGDLEEARLFLDLGYTFSFTGVVTFARNYDEVVRYLPLDRIMSETDCPYVSPVPHRGKRNEPSYVIEVVKAIAKIRGEDEEIVRKQLVANAERYFGISL